MTLALLTLPVAGCVTSANNYCDIASPLYFENNSVVDTLARDDRSLLSAIVTHNETWGRLCR